MLYGEKLTIYDKEVGAAVDKLFAKAYKCQSHESDLFLIIIHGFFQEDVFKWNNIPKLSPYVFGPGDEGLMNTNQYEYYDYYRNAHLIQGDPIKHQEYYKTLNDWQLRQSLTTQMELMLYLKFWESDLILKQFYNLCRLIHGEPYDWHKKLGNSRKQLIEFDIKNKAKNKCPKFFDLIDKTYNRQIRNASAHSQFWANGSHLNLFNYDPCANFHLKGITIDEWEIIFHKTILLYNHLLKNFNNYHLHYRELAKGKHFGHQIRIIKKHAEIKYDWIRLSDPEDVKSPWMWFDNYFKHYAKRFHIVIK